VHERLCGEWRRLWVVCVGSSELKAKAVKAWPSVVAAVALNLIPIAGVLFWDWSPFALIYLYWLENVAIGGRTFLSMVASGPSAGGPDADWLGLARGLALGGFFLFHYGMFCTVHGIFVVALFGGDLNMPASGGPGDLYAIAVRLFAEQPNLAVGFGSIVLWQAVQIALFILRGEATRANPSELMAAPYPRVIVLHMTIIGAGFLLLALGEPLAGLAMLAFLKAGFDVSTALGWELKPRAPELA
jgi:hypothetical protein